MAIVPLVIKNKKLYQMTKVIPLTFADANSAYDNVNNNFETQTVQYMVDDCAKRYPENIAINFKGTHLTFTAINEASNKLARLLIDQNKIQTGDIIGVAISRSPEMVIALLAILKSGAAYLPLDPEYPKDRIEFMLADSSAKILFTSRKYHSQFASDAIELIIEDIWTELDDYDGTPPPINVSSHDLAYILFTSGSTGKPKGVMITHGNLVNFLLSMQALPGIKSTDKLLALTTISFDIAGLELFLPLISGAQIVLASADDARDGWGLLSLIKTERVSIIQATPYTYRILLAAGWEDFLPVTLICGGEALPKDLVDKLLPRCASLWNQYGPTETTVYSTQKLIVRADDITIGKPIDNTEVYILDENLCNLTDGSAGEIFIAGSGVAKGYLNRPQLTEERFIDNPFSEIPGEKMYRTGDLGRLTPNGEIECLGRIDHQVKVRGYRIEPSEIEYLLLKQPDVKEAVVIARTDIADEPRLCAYIVLNSLQTNDTAATTDTLQKALGSALPAYMVPDNFVFLKTIEITPNGKIDRKALPKPASNPGAGQSKNIAPRTETEKIVAEIWKKLMRLDAIDVNDNFFDLGGHSLMAIQIMARIKKVTGKQFPLATLFEHSTIEKLAAKLDSDKSEIPLNSLVPIRPTGTKPPLYIVHGEGLNVLLFNTLARYMDSDQPVYGLQALGLSGGEPIDVMEEIAAKYVAEIVAQNPTGPYLLAGYSFGGYVAVEMRKQLEEMGREVKMLIIFDTDAEKSEYKKWYILAPKKIRRHLPNVLSYLRLKTVSLVKRLQHREQLFNNMATADGVKKETKDFYKEIDRITNKYKVALTNYQIRPFNDKIHLFRAERCVHYVDDTEFLGWKRFAKQGVVRYDVPGDHLSILNSPNAERFASVLQDSIDRFLEN